MDIFNFCQKTRYTKENVEFSLYLELSSNNEGGFANDLIDFLRSNESERFRDFTIKSSTNGQEVKTTRIILSARSAYFRGFFRVTPEANSVVLPYPIEVIHEIVKGLVYDEDYFVQRRYKLERIKTAESFMAFIEAVDYLDLFNFKYHMEHWILDYINEENCLQMFDLVKRLLIDDTASAKTCLSYILSVLVSLFKSRALFQLDKDQLMEIFSADRQLTLGMTDDCDRKLDPLGVELVLVKVLFNLLQEKDQLQDFPEFIEKCFKKDILYSLIIKDFSVFRPHKTLLLLQSIPFALDFAPYQLNPQEDLAKVLDGLCPRPNEPQIWQGRYLTLSATLQPPQNPQGFQPWRSSCGKIQKLCFKFRDHPGIPDERIVQGIKILFQNGRIEAFGMHPEDTEDVEVVEIEENSCFASVDRKLVDNLVTSVMIKTTGNLHPDFPRKDPKGRFIRRIDMGQVCKMEVVGFEGQFIHTHDEGTFLTGLECQFAFAPHNLDKTEILMIKKDAFDLVHVFNGKINSQSEVNSLLEDFKDEQKAWKLGLMIGHHFMRNFGYE